MKRFLVIALAATCIAVAMPVMSMAATKNYVSNDLPVKAEYELRGQNAPVLTIEKNEDHRENFSFTLNLSNAEWLYQGTGNIVPGVKYTVISGKILAIEVDMATFDPRVTDINVPLETKVDSAGVAEVIINPGTSMVSEGSYTFAHVSFPAMGITVSNVDNVNGKFDLNFKDNYPYSMVAGSLFKVSIDNGFVFSGEGEADGTGKYENRVAFKVDSVDKSTAYIELTQFSGASNGEISIKGIKVAGTEKTEKRAANINVDPLYGEGGTISFTVDNFVSDENLKSGTQILFKIGESKYTVDVNKVNPIDAAPFIDENGRTMLPLRALANAFSISDDDIKWNDAEKTVTLKNKEGKEIVATVNSTLLKVGVARVTMDTTAVIKDGRTYLPMRAILNAMGVAEEDIVWDDKAKTVLVYYK